jgi:hypothetical protein
MRIYRPTYVQGSVKFAISSFQAVITEKLPGRDRLSLDALDAKVFTSKTYRNIGGFHARQFDANNNVAFRLAFIYRRGPGSN